ncbi:MAG TPA: hypothetical protein VJU17_05885 [Gemmatimonadales bacterium]|nr:hypothetical protein [Gemmatimonadales bacterium]
MSVTSTNLLGGAAEVYTGVFGAVEPLSTAVADPLDDEVWIDKGGTDGGVKMNVERDFFDLRADQIFDPAGTRQVNRTTTLETNLAEITLENLALGWGERTSSITSGGTAGTAWKALETLANDSAEEPNYHALIIRGWAPNHRRRLIIARKVLSVAAVGTEYKKDGQTFIPVQFKCFYVSSSIAPVKVVESAAP